MEAFLDDRADPGERCIEESTLRRGRLIGQVATRPITRQFMITPHPGGEYPLQRAGGGLAADLRSKDSRVCATGSPRATIMWGFPEQVGVHGSMVTVAQQRTRRGSMKADLGRHRARGNHQGALSDRPTYRRASLRASVSSDRRAQHLGAPRHRSTPGPSRDASEHAPYIDKCRRLRII
jgi:hypothetical protein